jgi:hypothetical protein
MRFPPPFLYRVSVSLELVSRIIYLTAKKSSWTESFYYVMAHFPAVEGKRETGK